LVFDNSTLAHDAVGPSTLTVIEDQEFGFGDGLEHAGVTAVAPGDGQRLEQPWHAVIGDGASVTAGFVAQGAGNPAFAQAGWVRIPTKPAMHSNLKPATDSDTKPASVPI